MVVRMNNEILKNMTIKNYYLVDCACHDDEAIYLRKFKKDIRGTFYRDIDKIIYTLSYIRYMDKTQVFSFIDNNHITKRMLHVQLVSKIARTIGRALGLNEDLIEAIALGHDLGHVPFGHVGEKILNDISLKHNEGYFNHNIHSVRMLLYVENYGKGLDVSLQTLDGIMCHNGEFECQNLRTIKKNKEQFFQEYAKSYSEKDFINTLVPMTLEACCVRISDMIAYLGRDIEDAIRLKIIKTDDIPNDISEVLGKNNREIIKTITMDVINSSINQTNISLSNEVFQAVKKLKKFNAKSIYAKANTENSLLYYRVMFNMLFDKYLDDIKFNKTDSIIFTSYLNNMCYDYKNNNTSERIVIDYIAGMTDEFIKKQYDKLKEYNN